MCLGNVRVRTQWAPRKKSVRADLVVQKAVREEKLPLVQSDVADHEVDLDNGMVGVSETSLCVRLLDRLASRSAATGVLVFR